MLGNEIKRIVLRVCKESFGIEFPGLGGEALLLWIVKGQKEGRALPLRCPGIRLRQGPKAEVPAGIAVIAKLPQVEPAVERGEIFPVDVAGPLKGQSDRKSVV